MAAQGVTTTITETFDSTAGPYGATIYVVTVRDNGRTVMTFHTGNRDEAESIGPKLLAFLGH